MPLLWGNDIWSSPGSCWTAVLLQTEHSCLPLLVFPALPAWRGLHSVSEEPSLAIPLKPLSAPMAHSSTGLIGCTRASALCGFMAMNDAHCELLTSIYHWAWCVNGIRDQIKWSFPFHPSGSFSIQRTWCQLMSATYQAASWTWSGWVHKKIRWGARYEVRYAVGTLRRWTAHSFPQIVLDLLSSPRACDSMTHHTYGKFLSNYVEFQLYALCFLWSMATPGTYGTSPCYKKQMNPKHPRAHGKVKKFSLLYSTWITKWLEPQNMGSQTEALKIKWSGFIWSFFPLDLINVANNAS